MVLIFILFRTDVLIAVFPLRKFYIEQMFVSVQCSATDVPWHIGVPRDDACCVAE